MIAGLSPKIYVAGHRGMAGSAIVRALRAQGEANIVTRSHAELDLVDQAAVRAFFEAERPDQVYLAAAKVGGIHANDTYPAAFIYQNLIIEANVIHEAWRAGVKKLMFLGSSCIYPRLAHQPMREEALLTGPLEPTNEPYAIAKIAGIKLCESYNREYGESHGTDYRSVMPSNLYGPGDNYHPQNSHVVPALIRRFHEAKINHAPQVTIWGTGTPRREFLYVDDMAAACLRIMNLDKETYEKNTQPMRSHINVGAGYDVTIRDLAEAIRKIAGYHGRIEFDTTKPDGAPAQAHGQHAPERPWLADKDRLGGGACDGLCRLSRDRRGAACAMSTPAKVALITGITGQDGSYLAEFLLEKGYEVHGIKRRASSFNTQRVDHIYQDPHIENVRLTLHYGDLTDTSNIVRILQEIQPDEIYNLGAQSHVAVSFEAPEYTADVDAIGTLRLLEAIRILKLEKKTRFYQASSSELFGLVQETPQKETTPFHPRSPYAVAKLYAHWICVNYREAYGIYACNGILFNHESPRRGESFVTRKITRGLANISQGLEECLYLGNIDARRDWGHAKDYVRVQWLMLQQENPEDFVIATGKQYSVRQFVEWSAAELGIELEFRGHGLDLQGVVKSIRGDKAPALKVGDVVVRIDPRYFRPTEVEALLGDSSRARQKLRWLPEISAQEMCREMIASDLQTARQQALLKTHGHAVVISVE